MPRERRDFVVIGLPGVLLALVVAFVLKDPRRHATMEEKAAGPTALTGGATLRLIFGSRAGAADDRRLARGLPKLQQNDLATIFFQRTHGLSPGEVGLYFGLLNGVSAIAGTWLGGRIADRWDATNRRHVLTAPGLGLLVAAPLAYLGYSAPTWQSALATWRCRRC